MVGSSSSSTTAATARSSRSQHSQRHRGLHHRVLTFTPYYDWRYEHARHHATAGDLDRRGFGDVWTMTVDEYRQASWLQRLGYRLYRNPLRDAGHRAAVRVPRQAALPAAESTGTRGRAERAPHRPGAGGHRSGRCSSTIGVGTTLLVQLPILAMAGAAGVWLFYVQHQFETRLLGAPRAARLRGGGDGGQLVLRAAAGAAVVLRQHRLSPHPPPQPAIPNYRLPKCFREQPLFQRVDRLTLRSSLRSLRLRLYDERARRLVGFRQALTS